MSATKHLTLIQQNDTLTQMELYSEFYYRRLQRPQGNGRLVLPRLALLRSTPPGPITEGDLWRMVPTNPELFTEAIRFAFLE